MWNIVIRLEDLMKAFEILELGKIGDVTVVTIKQARLLDETTIKMLGDELITLIEREYKIKLLVDFSNVNYLSSAVLGKLISVHKKVKSTNGTLKFANLSIPLLEIFKITKLDTVFSIYSSTEKGMFSFRNQAMQPE